MGDCSRTYKDRKQTKHRRFFKIFKSGHAKCMKCKLHYINIEKFKYHNCAIGFDCLKCTQSFKQFREYRSHNMAHKKSKFPVEGSFCGGVLKSEEAKVEIKRRCNLCFDVFDTSNGLMRHILIHKYKSVCDYCGIRLGKSSKAYFHLKKCAKIYRIKNLLLKDLLTCKDNRRYMNITMSEGRNLNPEKDGDFNNSEDINENLFIECDPNKNSCKNAIENNVPKKIIDDHPTNLIPNENVPSTENLENITQKVNRLNPVVKIIRLILPMIDDNVVRFHYPQLIDSSKLTSEEKENVQKLPKELPSSIRPKKHSKKNSLKSRLSHQPVVKLERLQISSDHTISSKTDLEDEEMEEVQNFFKYGGNNEDNKKIIEIRKDGEGKKRNNNVIEENGQVSEKNQERNKTYLNASGYNDTSTMECNNFVEEKRHKETSNNEITVIEDEDDELIEVEMLNVGVLESKLNSAQETMEKVESKLSFEGNFDRIALQIEEVIQKLKDPNFNNNNLQTRSKMLEAVKSVEATKIILDNVLQIYEDAKVKYNIKNTEELPKSSSNEVINSDKKDGLNGTETPSEMNPTKIVPENNRKVRKNNDQKYYSAKFKATSDSKVNEVFKCDKCNVTFSKKELKLFHFCCHTSEEEGRTCVTCHKVFTDKETLSKHLKTHKSTESKNFATDSLNQQTESVNVEYSEQMASVEKVQTENYCQMENFEEVTEIDALNNDKIITISSTDSEMENGVCSKCGRTFENLLNYIKHFCVTCNVCRINFTSRTSFLDHMTLHENECDYEENDYQKQEIRIGNSDDRTVSNARKIKVVTSGENEPQREELIQKDAAPLIQDISLNTDLENKELQVEYSSDVDEERPCKCRNCVKEFTEINLLKEHMKTHNGIHYKCYLCSASYLQRKDCYSHLRTFHKLFMVNEFMAIKVYKSLRANQDETSKYSDMDMKNDEAKDPQVFQENQWTCTLCDNTFSEKAYVKLHLPIHDCVKHHCNFCEQDLPLNNFLKDHMKTCKSYVGLSDVNLQTLMEEIDKVNEKYVTPAKEKMDQKTIPDECNDSEKVDSCNHICLEKINNNEFCCRVCLKMFNEVDPCCSPLESAFDQSTGGSLHQEEASNKNENESKSDIKNETNKVASAIQNQKTSGYLAHNTESNCCSDIKCPQCCRNFKNSIDLKRHMQKHISSEKHTCNVCKEKFTLLMFLKEHMVVHKSEYCFSCSVCGHRFRNRKLLRGHKQIHSIIGKSQKRCRTI